MGGIVALTSHRNNSPDYGTRFRAITEKPQPVRPLPTPPMPAPDRRPLAAHRFLNDDTSTPPPTRQFLN